MKMINKRKKNKVIKKYIPILFLLLFFVIIYFIYILYIPNYKTISFYNYNNIDKNDINIILEDKLVNLKQSPIIKDRDILIPITFVKNNIDKNVYWENNNDKVIITTLDKLIIFQVDNNVYKVNYKPFFLKTPIRKINNLLYIPVDILEKFYNIKINYEGEYNIITIDYNKKDIQYAKVEKNKSVIRHKADIKSKILKKITQNTEFIVFDYDKNNKYTKVRTQEGFVGYIKTNNIKLTKIDRANIKEEKIKKIDNNINGKINLVWDNISNKDLYDSSKKRINHIGVNVLSPTWLTFNKERLNGDIVNLSDISYVKWAHKNGYKVWALLSDNENSKITSNILTSLDKRQKAILNILKICEEYELDGINIDFERVPQDYIDYFLQFLRELTPILREKEIIVSVDTFVPTIWSMYYNRAEIGRVVDYVCVMTYDENTSSKSGPNASIPFVEKGIKDTIFEIPEEKVIMGIPFYVRIWKEKQQEEEIICNSRSVSMDYAYEIILKANAEVEWLEDMGIYYSEFEEEDKDGEVVTYRIWLEDNRSIKEKVKLVKKYNLAGVAGWARGLEGKEVFEIIDNYLN